MDHILSDLSTMTTRLGWPHTAWLSFIELDKAVVLVSCIKVGLFFFFNTYVFFFGCAGSPLLHSGFLQLWRVRSTFHCGAWTSCGGVLSCAARALGARASVVAALRLGSCDSWASLLHSTWNPPRPGIEPMSPAVTIFKFDYLQIVDYILSTVYNC